MAWSITVAGSVLAALIVARSRIPGLRGHVTLPVIILTGSVIVPLCLTLYFAAGKPTVQPLPAGVNVMNSFGCCSQGLVFSRGMAQRLKGWYAKRGIGFADALTEEFGDRFGHVRWAITPSVLQHVGSRSSKVEGGEERGMSIAAKMWSFAFEINDADNLRWEHDRAIGLSDL